MIYKIVNFLFVTVHGVLSRRDLIYQINHVKNLFEVNRRKCGEAKAFDRQLRYDSRWLILERLRL